MKNFFEKTKKLPHGHLRELAALCAGAALLLFAAVFVSGGLGGQNTVLSSLVNPSSQTASVWPCGWFDDCPSAFIYNQYFDSGPTTAVAGQSITLSWNIFGEKHAQFCFNGSTPCSITPDAPRSPSCVTHFEGHNLTSTGYCTGNIAGTDGLYTVTPTKTTTYYLCSDYLNENGVGCASYTITVPVAAPTALASFTANPATVQSGSGSTLAWVGTKGTNFYACELVGGQWGSGAWFSALPGSIATDALTANTTYSMDCFDTTPGVSTGWQSATVTVTAPTSQPSCPSGDTGTYPNCVAPTCPSGDTGTYPNCVAPPTCSNGLANSYAPGCNCAALGQVQSGSLCVAPPPTTCNNGLDSSYAPGCDCAALGKVKSGSQCVLAGAINSLTANPSRVLKGGSTTVSWSTSNMATCALSGLDTLGTSALSSALSSSVPQAISGKTIFTLSCIDNAGIPYSSSVTVNLIPQTIEQ